MRFLCGGMIVVALGAAGCADGDAHGDRPERSRSPEAAKRCLEADGFQTEDLRVDTRVDLDAPDRGLLAYRSGTHVEIAFYDDLGRAKRFEPELRERSEGFDGRVARIGRATIVWLMKPPAPTREAVERCVRAP